MDIKQALQYKLVNTAGVSNLVGTRVHRGKLPQDQTAPYVIIYKISDVTYHSFDGASKLAEARIQLSIFASTDTAAQAVASAIQTAIDGFKGLWSTMTIGRCFKDDETDLDYSDNIGLYGIAVDYQITYQY